MKKQKTVRCWGIPYGLTTNPNGQEVTIEMRASSIKEFREKAAAEQIKLTGKPYTA